MVWKAGQSGNPTGNQGPKAKPMRDALRLELAAAEIDDEPMPVKAGTMRDLARVFIAKARGGDVSAYIEIANRIDGKVAQPIAGDDEAPPARLELVWLTGLAELNASSSHTALENHSASSTNGSNDGPPSLPTAEPEKP
jgi:hypothetical protein